MICVNMIEILELTESRLLKEGNWKSYLLKAVLLSNYHEWKILTGKKLLAQTAAFKALHLSFMKLYYNLRKI